MIEAEFWTRLDYLRESKGITGRQICQECGIKENTFKQWRFHLRMPDAESLLKMASFLNVSTDYLLSGKNAISSFSDRVLAIARAASVASDEDLTLIERVLRISKNNSISAKKYLG